MDHKGYYSVLGIPDTASKRDIDRAYSSLANKYDPRKNRFATASLLYSKIDEAYDVLSDETKRMEYNCASLNLQQSSVSYSQSEYLGKLNITYSKENNIKNDDEKDVNTAISDYVILVAIVSFALLIVSTTVTAFTYIKFPNEIFGVLVLTFMISFFVAKSLSISKRRVGSEAGDYGDYDEDYGDFGF